MVYLLYSGFCIRVVRMMAKSNMPLASITDTFENPNFYHSTSDNDKLFGVLIGCEKLRS